MHIPGVDLEKVDFAKVDLVCATPRQVIICLSLSEILDQRTSDMHCL